MTYSTSPTVSATRRVILPPEIREYLEKAKPPAPYDPHDPLATDKIVVGRWLKKNDLTLNDEAAFWAKHEHERRRELHEMREAQKAKVQAEPEKADPEWLEYVNSRPTELYGLPAKFNQMKRTRLCRAKKKAATASPIPRPPRAIPFERITAGWHTDKLALLCAWTTGTGPQARKLRGNEVKLTKAAVIYQALTSELKRQPSHGELAARLGCSRPAAQNRIDRLVDLYAPGGPWHLKNSVTGCIG